MDGRKLDGGHSGMEVGGRKQARKGEVPKRKSGGGTERKARPGTEADGRRHSKTSKQEPHVQGELKGPGRR